MSGRQPQRHRRPPPRRESRHEDTVVAYHNYLQQLIKDRLNAVDLGPGRTPFIIAMILYAWGLCCCVVGILVIGLRSRHLYLTGVWERFVGPLFIIFFLLSFWVATVFLVRAKRKSNKYRRNLKFQPLGQFGVKVVHTTRLPHEKIMREEYKTGSTPHVSARPPRHHKPYSHRYGQSNRGYMPDNGYHGREYGREYGPPQAERNTGGPPDVIPGRPRQYKSRVVIQQQQSHQVPGYDRRSHAEEDSSV